MVVGVLERPTKSAGNYFRCAVITTHRIECEADRAVRHAHRALRVGDVRVRRRSADDLTAAIGSALRAGMVGALNRVALRATIHRG
jgi:hypothetical protein